MRIGRQCVGLGLGVLLMAAACSNGRETQATQELVWAVPNLDIGFSQDIAGMWNEAHPGGPTVRIERLPEAADDQRRLMAVELNARLPRLDVLSLDVVWTGEFAGRNWLVDLQAIRDAVTKESLKAPLESASWNGRLWGAPFTSGAGILYYRKDLLPGGAPRTYADLAKAVADVRSGGRPGIRGLVGQGAQYEGLVVNYLEYLWGHGGDLARSDNGIDLSTGPAIAALTHMRDSLRSGPFAPNFDTMKEGDALASFAAGEAVFMRNWPYAYKELREKYPAMFQNVGIARLPTIDGSGESAATGGSNLAVSRFSRNAKAATEFVRFASTEPRVQVLLGTLSRPPTMASAYEHPAVAARPDMKLLGEVLRNAHARPSTQEWSAISNEIQQHVFPSLKGRVAPSVAVDSIRSFLTLTVGDR